MAVDDVIDAYYESLGADEELVEELKKGREYLLDPDAIIKNAGIKNATDKELEEVRAMLSDYLKRIETALHDFRHI